MILREAAADDAALISRMIAASWRSAYQGLIDPVFLGRLPDEFWLSSMRSWLCSGRMYGYIALEDERAVGCVIYGRGRDDAYGDWGEIVALYMLPEHMNHGGGSLLLNAALSSLHEDGFEQVYLWAIDGYAPADSFYRRRGFVRSTEQEHYMVGQKQMTDVRYILGGLAR